MRHSSANAASVPQQYHRALRSDTSAHNQSDDTLDDRQEAIGEVLTPSSAIPMARIVRETRRAAAL